MGSQIHISDIRDIVVGAAEPVYLQVLGAIAAGKNHVIENKIPELVNDICDVDMIMSKNNWTDYYGLEFEQAMLIITQKIQGKYERRENIVAIGTNSNLGAAQARLKLARENSYKTVQLFVDATYEQCLIQNEKRRAKGERALGEDRFVKIHNTLIGSKKTFFRLRDTALVDYWAIYKNQ